MARLLCVLAAVVASARADDTKRIKDPVVRHDARQCGQYLCPAYPNAAEKYILDGCESDFESYAGASTSLNAVASAEAAATGITTSTLVALAAASGLVALVVGFVAGKRGGRSQPGYLPVRTKGGFDFDEVSPASGQYQS